MARKNNEKLDSRVGYIIILILIRVYTHAHFTHTHTHTHTHTRLYLYLERETERDQKEIIQRVSRVYFYSVGRAGCCWGVEVRQRDTPVSGNSRPASATDISEHHLVVMGFHTVNK